MKVENLDQSEAWSARRILGPGKHKVVIQDAQEGQSSGGHPQLEIEFESVDDPGAGCRDWLVVIPKTYGKVKMLLEAAGIPVQSGDWDIPVGDLKGRQLFVFVQEKPDRNDPTKTRTDVAGYEALPDGTPIDTRGMAPAGAGADDEDLPF